MRLVLVQNVEQVSAKVVLPAVNILFTTSPCAQIVISLPLKSYMVKRNLRRVHT